jgi:regulator of replication initiation timing
MLGELRSLGTDQVSIARFRELNRKYGVLIQQMPPDVSASLRSLSDSFVTEYTTLSMTMSKLEEKLRADARAAEAKKEEDQKNANQIKELQPLYIIDTVIQVCADRFADFKNAKSSMEDFIKAKETGLPSQLVKQARSAMAEQYKKMRSIMNMYGSLELYMQCDQTTKYVAGLMMFSSPAR